MSSYWSLVWPEDCWGRGRTVAIAALACFVVKTTVGRIRGPNTRKFQASRFSNKSGTLILHQFERGKYCPNLSPFALKLECFLRLAKIPYTVDTTVPFGPKGKCPWVNMEDGRPLGDSGFILDKIIDTEKSKSSSGRLPPGESSLSPRERGALEGMTALVEGPLFWCLLYYRYYLDRSRVFLTTQRFSWFTEHAFTLLMPHGIRKRALAQGIGVHSPQEVYAIACRTCEALDSYLGDSPYFCGEFPGSADCAVFGMIAQMMWNAPGTQYEAIVTEKFPRLSCYCNRMKETVFPDWEEVIKEGYSG